MGHIFPYIGVLRNGSLSNTFEFDPIIDKVILLPFVADLVSRLVICGAKMDFEMDASA